MASGAGGLYPNELWGLIYRPRQRARVPPEPLGQEQVPRSSVDVVGEKTPQSNAQGLACPIEIGRLDPKNHPPTPASRTDGLGCNDVDPLGSQFLKIFRCRTNAILPLDQERGLAVTEPLRE